MDKITKKMFDIYVELDGYFLVICDDENIKQDFINEIRNDYSNIEILSDYTFNDPWSIRDKLKTHPVLLVNVENKLEEVVVQNIKYHKEKYSSNLSYKDAVYVSLIGLREFLRINPLLFLGNSKTAYNIYYNDPQLSAFARNYIYIDDENYPQKFISEKVKKLYKDYKKTN